MKPISVYMLTGYLGAGKTTALNHLLKLPPFSQRRLALIINEFGKLGVDGKLVEPGDYSKFEINKGSLFCICTKTDFLKALDSILNDLKPEVLLIEATGIAETRDIEGFFDEPHLKDRFEVTANICLVDAVNFTKMAAFMKAVRSQVYWADAIVVNKCDSVTEAQVEKLKTVLQEMNPDAALTAVSYGAIAPDFFDRLQHRRHDGALVEAPPVDMIAVGLQIEGAMHRRRFMQTLEDYQEKILRLKGNVAFEDGDRFVEVVADRVIEKDHCENMEGRTAFTVICFQCTKEEITAAFENCRAE